MHPHTFSDNFKEKGQFHVFQKDIAALAVLIQQPLRVSPCFLLNLNSRLICFVSQTLMLSSVAVAPRPTFTATAENAVELFNHSFAFYPSRHVFALVDPRMSPPCFGWLSAFILTNYLAISAGLKMYPRILKFSAEGACSVLFFVLITMSSLSSSALVLAHHRLAAFSYRSHLSASPISSFIICSKCILECDIIQ